jgi:toxin YhaV
MVYAEVNDENTKRAYPCRDDAYRVFSRMLESGHLPDNRDELIVEAGNTQRLG